MRKVFLDKLPRKGKRIDWKSSIGMLVRFIFGDIEGWVEIVGYDKENHILHIKYQNQNIFKINSDNFKKCTLGKLLGKYTNEFKIEIGTHFKDDKRDITIIDRKFETIIRKDLKKETQKWYKYKCNKCDFNCGEHYKNGEFGSEYWVLEGSLIKGIGCGCCNPTPKIVVPHINSIVANPETHWMIKFFQGGWEEAKKYTKSSGQYIHPICPDCGRVKGKEISIYSIYNEKLIGCSCGDGIKYPNKFAFSLLEQLNIKFEVEYSPRWIKPKRYDFYFKLNNKEYIIEMDGGWHKVDNKISGKTAKESNENDKYKERIADQHEIEVIRINCEKSELDFIKDNILNSKLNTLFNLSNIDWLKCEEFALSNRTREACEIKMNNPDMTTSQIVEIMKLSRTTIIKYLKKGTKLGWCKYDPKEEMRKSSNNNGGQKGKSIEIFKEGISLGVFESGMELERQSEELFGVKLLSSKISLVANQKINNYKNYTFEFKSA